jgi:hypothetical protein
MLISTVGVGCTYQTSISAQQAPIGPTPAFLSFVDGFQPSTLAFHLLVNICLIGRGPDLYLAADELQVSSALGVAVPSSIFGSGLVGGVTLHTSILFHGNKVQGSVETAVNRGEIDIKGELVVHEREHLDI